MKVRLVTQVEAEVRDAVAKLADRETRTESSMANILLQEALAARSRKAPRLPMHSDNN